MARSLLVRCRGGLACAFVGVALLAASGSAGAAVPRATAPASEAAHALRVMTYNAHWAEQTSARTGHATGVIDLGRIASEIRRSGAEVVFLQELQSYRIGGRVFSESNALARLLGWTQGGVSKHAFFHTSSPLAIWCRKNGRAVVKRIDGRPGRCFEHGNAILSKYALRDSQFIDLFRPDGNLRDGDLYGAQEGRSGLRARITVAGTTLWVATVHLAREPSVATCQLRDLIQRLAGLRPLLLGGDFNMETTTRASPRCEGASVWPLSQLKDAGLIRGEPGGRTYPAFRPREHIDHFFASPPLSLQTVRPLDNCYRGRCSSDHRPQFSNVVIPP